MEFKIGGKTLKSRFFIGSGKLPTYAILPEMIEKSGVEVITVAVRRINPEAQHENILDFIPGHCVIMVNTSGATTADEAVKIARIGRELTGSDWIKIEVETDAKYLLPDNEETLKAAEIWWPKGFRYFPISARIWSWPKNWKKPGWRRLCRWRRRLGRTRALPVRPF